MRRFSFLLRLPVVLFAAHLYVALRLGWASPSLEWRAGLIAVIAIMYLSIWIGFRTRRSVGKPSGDAWAWAGFVALGAFSWLFVLTVLRELVLLAGRVAISLDALTLHGFNDLAGYSGYAVPALALAATLLGLFNARKVAAVKQVDIPIRGLPGAFDGFIIVQLSDVHVGPTIKRGYVAAMVHAANEQHPDVIALTGDLVDGSVEALSAHTAPFADLRATHGVFAVTGNHEYYSGALPWVAEFRRLGMKVLMNRHAVVKRGDAQLVIAGVTDFNAGAFDPAQESDPETSLAGAPPDAAARILLAHQPRSAPDAARAGFDLQLSGHTHGGQFWPWNHFVLLQQPFVAGLHRMETMWVYVSRGTGYWGPPLRLGARSEITRIRLVTAR